jgi:signal transduction histidine kinase
MFMGNVFKRFRHLDLQGKVILILFAVIFPVSTLLGLAQSRVLEPVMFDEIRQVGISLAQNFATQIQTQHLLTKPNASALLEDRIQQLTYAQPSILRIDIIKKLPDNSTAYLASNIEDQEKSAPPADAWRDQVSAELGHEEGIPVWSIYVPVKSGNERANIHVLTSLRFVTAFQSTTLRINLIAALISTVLLILILSFLLRRAIVNERQLKVAQISNEMLSGKLQEIQQALIHTEKLAVMGQLTASFAHEIGTPLNAVSGHMQLLNMSLENSLKKEDWPAVSDRMGIISSQVRKIEDIVKGFLQTTKKPIAQQKSIVPARELIERVLALVQPMLQQHQISFGQEFLAKKDQVEVVPIEIEQVLLNLVNNAIDSMRERVTTQVSNQEKPKPNALWIRTRNDPGQKTVTIEIEDTGTGISAENLKRIFKPFFTTKSAGEGHGLGLSICSEIVRAYGGELLVETLIGKGTRMKVQLQTARVRNS